MLAPGRRLGPYEILGSLGVGGMGEVYRARDTRLGRDVAIKILPLAFSSDPDRLARFEREARALASLNHPHIAAIYGIEESSDIKALVLELVEGETLADRLARRRATPGLALAESLSIARQIADALDAAHERGIAHRDLKPANIALSPAGVVKVLDFGLAKIAESSAAPSTVLTGSPTANFDPTQAGLVLGTPAYMSPEQARGEPVDRRTDIWAFGCVLFEMLTGRAPFAADSIAGMLGEILKSEPDWGRLPAGTPESVRRLIARCLQKDRTLRWHHAADVRIGIDEIAAHPEVSVSSVPTHSNRRSVVLAATLAGAVAVAVLAALLGGLLQRRPGADVSQIRVEITAPPTFDSSMAISPDGRNIVFTASSNGVSQLWLRAMDSLTSRPIPGTEGGSLPFWSPDSRSIAFFADIRLKRVDLDRGLVQPLALAPAALGGAWSRDGTIIFSTNPGRPIFRLVDGNTKTAPVTRFEAPRQGSQSSPSFLADGRHFLFFVTGNADARGVYVGSLDSLDTKRLFDADTAGVFSPAGYVLFVRQGRLLAQFLDTARLEPKGEPILVADNVSRRTVTSVSSAGSVAYRTGSPDSGQRSLRWVDRSGRELETVVFEDTAGLGSALSPDGGHVAGFRYVNGNMDIWSYDRVKRTWNRQTFDSGDDIYPLWSPDGARMIFGSNRGAGIMNLYSKPVGGPTASEELLVSNAQPKFPMDLSRDGRILLYNELNANGDLDIWALPMSGDRTPIEVLGTEFNEQQPQFSPDGKWIAFQSDKAGPVEIYVQPYRGTGTALSASAGGGTQPRWNSNGKELFYIAPDDRLMAVPINESPDGTTLQAGTPVPLFMSDAGRGNTQRQHYMVGPDGQSFVVISIPETSAPSPITLILNWQPKP